jgi:hypothetical protein
MPWIHTPPLAFCTAFTLGLSIGFMSGAILALVWRALRDK